MGAVSLSSSFTVILSSVYISFLLHLAALKSIQSQEKEADPPVGRWVLR